MRRSELLKALIAAAMSKLTFTGGNFNEFDVGCFNVTYKTLSNTNVPSENHVIRFAQEENLT